jgi:5-methylcytosine-specific restriction enzyme subunit McrC
VSAEKIPIQNIYFLLCYALDHLQEKHYAEVRTEGCDRIWDLLATVLIRSTQQVVKRGVHRDYLVVRERRTLPRGKILLTEELRRPVIGSLVRTCEFDELSADILPNQIIRATLMLMLGNREVKAELRAQLRDVFGYFEPFSALRLELRAFRHLQLHRNMRHYRFVLDVCEFIHRQLLPSTTPGQSRFRDFLRDEARMGELFEQFVRNFFAKEQSRYRVSSPQVKWALDERQSSPGGLKLLPTMRTDICLEALDEKVIADCKFYSTPLKTHYEKTSFISDHLFQLFTYLKNQERQPGWEEARGMLLYATVDEPFDEHVHLHGHSIRVVSVRLDQEWQKLSAELLALLSKAQSSTGVTTVEVA